ncbi:helix-hairpin-helix domain-containing protein [bacterium]|nr:helix-hairpin-helix domain-containing protein [bacterium]
MRFRDVLNKIAFKFLSFRYEKGRQFYLSIFIAILIAIVILSLLTIRQVRDGKVKENILKTVLNSDKKTKTPKNTDIAADNSADNSDGGQREKTVKKIKVYICGEINNEGVYELSEGTRIVDLIAIAGGIKKDAYLISLNLAEILTDSQKVYIPSNKEISNSGNGILTSGNQDNNSGTKIININFAARDDLELLPGIGPELAQRIIDYRNTRGPFKKKEDLKNVTGIGDKKFNALKDFISV